jgi:tRNA A-37 threonylcarbamoyl transferase component Bud32
MPNPVPGTLLGSYQVEGVIGAGSMGDVFRGVDTGLGRKVAIKILAEKHKDSSELRARFVREGRAVAAIQHPNVVQVFATGTFEERPFIAMEFLEGADLGSTVEKHGPLASVVAAQAILDAAHGLDAACRAGLIHRDVKPSNLVRVKDGRVKVTDFGLAKPVDPGTEPALTALGVVVGTPDYIAPEQARGEAIDEKVDIYALGGTLYFLLAGIPPFRTGKPAEDKYLKVVARHLRQPPPDATTPNPAADPELAQLARQMMAKRPNERPDYPVLIAALEGIVDRLGGSSTGAPRARASTQRSQPISTPTPYGEGSPAVSDQMDTIAGGTDLGAELATVRGGPPGWSLALTGLSAAFLVGAAIFYFTRAAPAAGPGTTPADAAPVATAPADAAPAARPSVPTPAGMLLVTKPDGTPWFFVDAVPVTHADYGAFYRKHKVPKNAGTKPVTGVEYTFARAYAQTMHKRMLRFDEYDAAARTPGFVVAPGLMEWVDAAKDPQDMTRSPTAVETTAKTGLSAVTFRFAQDL